MSEIKTKTFDRVISARPSLLALLKETYDYKGLFYFLAWKDFKVRYKQTVIGVLWAFIRPFFGMLVFVVIFNKLAGFSSEGDLPYPLMVFIAMLPWHFFANGFQSGSNSLVANSKMISKVYFPRVIIPLSGMFVGLIDFLITLAFLVLLMVYYDFIPSVTIFFMPLFLIELFLLTAGLSLLFSAINVKFRDVKYITPFILQVGLYISPVGFSSEVVGEWRDVFSLNPLVGIIDGFRWCFASGSVDLYMSAQIISLIFSVLIFLLGFVYFSRVQSDFADVI